MKLVRLLVAGFGLLLALSLPAGRAQATSQDFIFEAFAGTYYLSRNASGVATLTSQEDMVVFFPPGGKLYGLNRALPEDYQGRNLNLKVISLTDAIGNPISYRTYSDGHGNLIVSIGDPSIIISGPQTYRLKYQTTGVAALYPGYDEFLIDVNGRGWQESFASVKAFISVDKSFASNLVSTPSCYIGYQNQNLNTCTISRTSKDGALLVDASTSRALSAHQALVIRLDFKKGTFQAAKNHHIWAYILGVVAALLLIALGLVYALKRRRSII